MPCKSKKCEDFKVYYEWEHFKVKDVENSFHLCDTDLLPSMPDNCSRCKRAYPDLFKMKS